MAGAELQTSTIVEDEIELRNPAVEARRTLAQRETEGNLESADDLVEAFRNIIPSIEQGR